MPLVEVFAEGAALCGVHPHVAHYLAHDDVRFLLQPGHRLGRQLQHRWPAGVCRQLFLLEWPEG